MLECNKFYIEYKNKDNADIRCLYLVVLMIQVTPLFILGATKSKHDNLALIDNVNCGFCMSCSGYRTYGYSHKSVIYKYIYV